MAINELRAISVFVTAAELGSLRKTAAALNISPQAASQALAQLEQHLDVRLFHRTTRPVPVLRYTLQRCAASAAMLSGAPCWRR